MRQITRSTFMIWALSAVPLAAFGQDPRILSRSDAGQIAHAVVNHRSWLITEGVRYNWCAVPEVWSEMGALLGEEEVILKATVKQKSECPTSPTQSDRPAHGSRVDIWKLNVYADSVVVQARIVRPNSSVVEFHVLTRWNGKYRVVIYRVEGGSQSE